MRSSKTLEKPTSGGLTEKGRGMSAIGAMIDLTYRSTRSIAEKVEIAKSVTRVFRFLLMVSGFVLLCLAAFTVSVTAGLGASGLACLILEWLISSGSE